MGTFFRTRRGVLLLFADKSLCSGDKKEKAEELRDFHHHNGKLRSEEDACSPASSSCMLLCTYIRRPPGSVNHRYRSSTSEGRIL